MCKIQLQCSQFQEINESVILPMTERDHADQLRHRGIHTVYHKQHYWKETVFGFYEPIHLMARLSDRQATCCPTLGWGFRSTLSESDQNKANAIMPIHLLSDLKNYSSQILSKRRRADLRKSSQQVKIVKLVDSSLLYEQGYEVVCSSLQRTKHERIPSKTEYCQRIALYTSNHTTIIAGLINNKLVAYITGWAIDGTAYMQTAYYATEALPTCVVTGLYYAFIQVCQQSDQIHEVVAGLHSRELPKLTFYKESMKFPIQNIPSKLRISPIMDKLIRWRYPHKYYRLTGED